jgi:hypothetical protein
MVDYLQWLNLLVWVLLSGACILLFLDGRGQRKAVSAAQNALAALQSQVTAHDGQIGNLSRAVALLTVPDARPTMAVQHPAADALASARARLPTPPAAAKVSTRETARLSSTSPASEASPSETVEAILARYQAHTDEQDAPDAERITPIEVSSPTPLTAKLSTDLSLEAFARVEALAAAKGIDVDTMLHRLAMSGLAVMTGAAEARELAPPEGPANDAPQGTPSPPLPFTAPGPRLDERVSRRWHALLAEAREQGKDARHCFRPLCLRDGFALGRCPCACEGCARVAALLYEAEREAER